MIRKILAVLVAIIAGLGVILCAGGLIGLWVINTPVTDTITSTAQTAEAYLALASSTTTTARSQIEDIRTQIDAFGTSVKNMTPETRTEITSKVRDAVQHKFGPTIDALRTTFTTLRTGIIALNRSLESANRIPGVNVPTLTDELQAADQRLGEIQDSLTALTKALADVSVDGSRIEALTAATSDKLAAVEGSLSQWNTKITTVDRSITAAASAAPEVIDWTSILLSLLLILFGAGQVCMIMRAVKSFQSQ
jgi:peptidoglycan hydrolase CwlO-like protein